MRLVCPNCDAEYEVDDAAIPREGRDVQCSNCGHAWFQQHPELEAEQEAEADLYEAPPGAVAAEESVTEPEPAPAPAPAPEPVPEEEPEDEDLPPLTVAADSPAPRPRTLDETVLAVLREEAEREVATRRAETQAPALESQTEMPLSAPVAEDAGGGMAAAVRRIAKLRGAAAEPVAPQTEAEPEPTPAQKSRGEMFPAIEEINSTLRATGDRGQDEEDAIVDSLPDLTRKRGGFGRGFVLLVGLAVVIVALYVMAPVIAAKVPSLAGAAKSYVTAVDAARVWLDANLRALVTTLRGMAGGQGG